MAPIKQNIKGKHFKSNFARGGPSHNAKGKRKWIPENKFFDGSLNEGQGFAFKRKEKIKHDYNKLLRKERRRMQQSRDPLKEEYPEHLKHLYLAEKERLEEEEQEKKKMRWKGRAVDDDDEEEQEHTMNLGSSSEKHTSNTTADQTHSSNEAEVTTQSESSHKAPHIPRKHKKMSSYQKTKQEYERMKEEQERKREKFLKDKAQREEALKKYKEKKMATYQLLKKKTKKGQPNLNLHMELLLQKIEAQRK